MELDMAERPMSVKEISLQAQEVKFDVNIRLKAYLRSAQTLKHEAGIYLREGNFAKAYLLYLRYTSLVLEFLGKQHPEAKTKEGKNALAQELTGLADIFSNLEKMKPLIQSEFEEWRINEAKRNSLAGQQQNHYTTGRSKTPTAYEKHASRDPTLYNARLLDASEHQDLAVDLAQREIKRRDANRKATRKAGVSAEEEQQRRTAGFWENWTDELTQRQTQDEEIFRQQLQSSRRKPDGSDDDHIQKFVQTMSRAERERDGLSGPSVPVRTSSSNTYRYPSISRPEPIRYESQPSRSRHDDSYQPARPPKDSLPELPTYRQSLLPTPDIPAKESQYSLPTPEPSQGGPDLPPKLLDEPPMPPAKKQRYTFKPSAYLENGEPIRSLFLPAGLREDFVSLASENTRRGIEMCGVLCGTAVNNALFVQCLVIPEQKCTPDTCETENESALFDYCMSQDLLQLGWIHTHPTQSCFMSSRDLHTQAGYQVMLPESIAVVCAPRFEPSYGIFRLTNPPGLPHILHCPEMSTFHPHSVDNLYTGADKPSGGHVYESPKLDYTVHDLRPGAKNNY